MKLRELPQKSKAILEKRINDELYAQYFYTSAASWCRDRGYTGGAKFFQNEAADEYSHAQKLIEYCNGWNVTPDLTNVEKPDMEFEALCDVIEAAYELELSFLDRYNKDSAAVFADDLNTFDLLTEFRAIQNSSVAEYADLYNQVELIGKNDKFGVFYFDKEVLGA